MKILLINGSPKSKGSNSLKLAYSFLEGFKDGCARKGEDLSIEELHVASDENRSVQGLLCMLEENAWDMLYKG